MLEYRCSDREGNCSSIFTRETINGAIALPEGWVRTDAGGFRCPWCSAPRIDAEGFTYEFNPGLQARFTINQQGHAQLAQFLHSVCAYVSRNIAFRWRARAGGEILLEGDVIPLAGDVFQRGTGRETILALLAEHPSIILEVGFLTANLQPV